MPMKKLLHNAWEALSITFFHRTLMVMEMTLKARFCSLSVSGHNGEKKTGTEVGFEKKLGIFKHDQAFHTVYDVVILKITFKGNGVN